MKLSSVIFLVALLSAVSPSLASIGEVADCQPNGTRVADGMRILVICISFLQFLFLLTRYPRVGWESLLVPFLEGFGYFLGLVVENSGNIGLATGYWVAWVRYAGWLVTVPVLLLQICALDPSENAKTNTNFMVAANQLMLVFGISASLFNDNTTIWSLFLIGSIMGLVVYYVVFTVLKRFIFEGGHGHSANKVVRWIAIVFYPSWTLFPILQVLGNENLCIINDDLNVSIHVLADILSKNIFGMLFWHLRWNLIAGRSKGKGGLMSWLQSKDTGSEADEPKMGSASGPELEVKLARFACVTQNLTFPESIRSGLDEAGCHVDVLCGPGIKNILPLVINSKISHYDVIIADECMLNPFGSSSHAEQVAQQLGDGFDISRLPSKNSALRESGISAAGIVVIAVLEKPSSWSWEALQSQGAVDYMTPRDNLSGHEIANRWQKWKALKSSSNVGMSGFMNPSTKASLDFAGASYGPVALGMSSAGQLSGPGRGPSLSVHGSSGSPIMQSNASPGFNGPYSHNTSGLEAAATGGRYSGQPMPPTGQSVEFRRQANVSNSIEQGSPYMQNGAVMMGGAGHGGNNVNHVSENPAHMQQAANSSSNNNASAEPRSFLKSMFA